MRIHLVAGLAVALLATAVRFPVAAQLALAAAVFLVLSAEVANSALEALVDLVTRERHPLARTAKDAGAATVLVLAAGSVVVGAVALVEAWPAVMAAAAEQPRWRVVAAGACLAAQAALLLPHPRSLGVDAGVAVVGLGLLASVLAGGRSLPFAALAVALFLVACATARRRRLIRR